MYRPLLVAVVATALLALPGSVPAATFTVTKTTDTLDGSCTPADCSLREAVTAANAASDPDEVVLPAGTYTLTLPDPGDDDSGGDLDILKATTITGAGARSTVIQSGGVDRVIDAVSGIAATITGVTLTGGGGVDSGAGLASGATLVLRDAAITGNATTQSATSVSRQGAGVFLYGPSATLERVLIAGNTAASKAGDSIAPQGAGLFANGAATLVNVTISGNTLDGTAGGSFGPQGAGLFVNDDEVTLENVTVANNTAVDGDSQGGGIFYNGTTTLRRTIVAGNRRAGVPDECHLNGSVLSAATNLATNAADCGFTAGGDLSADPLLAALANTGGPTDTHALGAGSPALDRAPFATCPALDQRGFTRLGAGAACDLGAHEVVAPPVLAPPVAPPPVAPTPPPPPRKLVAASVFTLPSAKRCVSRRAFRIRLRRPAGVTLKEARVFVNGQRVRVVRGKRLTAPVDLRGLPKGRFTVKVTASATDGRTVSDTRRYRTCAAKRRR